MSGKLVLIRHGESEWNLLGRVTGWTDVSLTEKGAADAKKMGELITDIHFDAIYTSKLKRSYRNHGGRVGNTGTGRVHHTKPSKH